MISSKVAKSIKILLTAYNSRILPCLHGVLPIMWGSTYSIHIPPLVGLQKKLFRS